MIERAKMRLPRPVRLIVVGAVATLAYSVFSLSFVLLLALAAPLASLLGHALAGFVSYFGHRVFTFEVTGEHKGAPARFIALNVSSYVIACVLPWFATCVFRLPDTAAILLTALVLPAVNVLLIAKFVFRAPLVERASRSAKIYHGN